MSRKPLYTNASLIREARMFAQNFFGARAAGNLYQSVREPQQKVPMLKCGRCMKLNEGGPAKNAITIYEGTALCNAHAVVAMATTKLD